MKIGYTILLALSLSSVTSAYAQTAKVIDDHFRALAAHDVKGVVTGYSDSARMYSANWEGAKSGVTGITEVYSRYFSSTPDLNYKVVNIIYANETVVAEYITSGTLSNPEPGTPAYMKDKKYTVNYCAVFTLKVNKIIKETDYFDQLAFLRQVGFFDQK